MRKPTHTEFFILEGLVWTFSLLLVGYYNDWHHQMALSIFFLKMSVTNVCFAILNMIGTSVGMATGWYPWQSR